MRQKLITRSFVLMFCLISSLAFGTNGKHLAELKSKYPHGLLSDDYGILTLNDLAINTCGVTPKPFNIDSRYYPYEYWQCFESRTISFDCDSNGIPDEYEGVMGLIVVKTSASGVQHEYIEHRLWPIKECKRFIKDAAHLLKGTEYACISGSFIENEKGRSGHLSSSWLFERIKTKKGCEGRHCDFTKEFKQENCPNFKSNALIPKTENRSPHDDIALLARDLTAAKK